MYRIDLDASIEEELDRLESDNMPTSSKKQMNSAIVRFITFLRDNKLSVDILKLPHSILNKYLRYFYSQLRKKDGCYYSPRTLVCFRAGIHRYMRFHRPDINIIDDSNFGQANRMLATMVGKFKTSGQPKPQSYGVIEEEDMKKIREYFDRSDGETLQREVMFNIIYYFGLRGRETLSKLSKESIICQTSSTGRNYLALNHELLTKNSKASLIPKEFQDAKEARAYECVGFPKECPVIAWKTYMERIKDSDNLFPKPCKLKSKKRNVGIQQSRKSERIPLTI